jgi:hypothetical protein
VQFSPLRVKILTIKYNATVYADPVVSRQSTVKPDEIETTPVRFGEGVPEKYRVRATRRHPTLPHVRFDERDLETEPSGHRARSRLYLVSRHAGINLHLRRKHLAHVEDFHHPERFSRWAELTDLPVHSPVGFPGLYA